MLLGMFDSWPNGDLFRRLHPLIASGGGLAIVSYWRERNAVAASFGVQMLVATRGGDAHGAGDYQAWLAAAGYGRVSIHDLDDSSQMIVLAVRLAAAGAHRVGGDHRQSTRRHPSRCPHRRQGYR